MNKKTLVLVLIGTITFTNLWAQKAITLKQNLTLGKKYTYEMNVDQNINQDVMGQQIDMKQLLNITYSFDIVNAIKQDKNIKVVYDKIYSLTEAMGASTEYDSAKDDGTGNNPLSALKGAGFTMVVSPKGEVKSVKGADEMMEKMAQKSSSDSATVEKVKEMLGKQFGNEALKSTMESSLKIYPDKPVKVGESWMIESSVQSMLPMNIKSTYTLNEVKDNKAYITVNSVISANGPAEIMGLTLQTNLNGQNNGNMVLDIKTGVALDYQVKVEIDGTMSAMGQNIKMKINGANKVIGKEL
ncbi:hypothetical protein C3K47_08305 [Solitalea longa]|uniref:Uncharacterized protein n=1 Tax=Solitalea longa TaxID=2079460 RepID=A0A2S5A389_9SPHI|nr:DUF6263 family protein [Solitalea longa]POY37050.1 hypothetical protein C3K47_08305 [Solitalea longa]